jgi:hypothetical protein
LKILQENQNLLLYSPDRFKEWLSFLKGLPQFHDQIIKLHIKSVLMVMRPDTVDKGLLSMFVEDIVKNEFAFKKDQRLSLMEMLVTEIMIQAPS